MYIARGAAHGMPERRRCVQRQRAISSNLPACFGMRCPWAARSPQSLKRHSRWARCGRSYVRRWSDGWAHPDRVVCVRV